MAALAALLVLAAAGAVDGWLHRLDGRERTLLAAAPDAAAAAGCGGVQEIRPYPGGLDRAHVGTPEARLMPPLSTYPSVPPASGPHSPTPLGAGEYDSPPPIGRTIHSLEHAAVIVWLAPAASGPGVGGIRSFFHRGDEQNHVIVAPYDYPGQGAAGRLPAGREMALVAWHRIRFCDQASLAVAFAFVHRLRFDLYQFGAYEGAAPEKWAPI